MLTNHINLSLTTSGGTAEDLVDRTSKHNKIRWFTIAVDNDAYIGINETATASSFKLEGGETYTTPDTGVRVVSISILRATASNVTVRGSAWA